jgi:hypothetical protein
MAWLEPAAKRTRDRVVSTLPLEVACERESVYPMDETEAEHVDKASECDRGQGLGEPISQHGSGLDIFGREDRALDQLSKIMEPDIDLLRSGVTDRVVSDGDRGLVVSIELD